LLLRGRETRSRFPALAYTAGGTGLCNEGAETCAFFYEPDKTFKADTVLATFRFKVQDDAAPGLIDFDLGVVVGMNTVGVPVPLPESQKFEVLGTIPSHACRLRGSRCRPLSDTRRAGVSISRSFRVRTSGDASA
jgi:hypothetical protein